MSCLHFCKSFYFIPDSFRTPRSKEIIIAAGVLYQCGIIIAACFCWTRCFAQLKIADQTWDQIATSLEGESKSIISYLCINRLPESNIEPARKPSQNESSLPIHPFSGANMLVSGRVGTWRIIPVSKWLVTMVSKSPK